MEILSTIAVTMKYEIKRKDGTLWTVEISSEDFTEWKLFDNEGTQRGIQLLTQPEISMLLTFDRDVHENLEHFDSSPYESEEEK